MDAVWRDVTVGNVTYKGVAGGSPGRDAFEVGVIRYIANWEAKTSDTFYWTSEGWVEFPAGGRFSTVRIHATEWPQGGYDVVALIQEPEAREALTAAIEALEEQRHPRPKK